MSNNPFRNEPSTNVQKDIEDWGKSKFKPKLFKRGNGREFGRNNRKQSYEKYNSQKSKLNEAAKDAKPENPTPWRIFKDEIIFKQREDRAAQQNNFGGIEAKATFKQREMNYRRSLVEQKKQETTKWEDFGEDNGDNKQKSRAETVGLGANKKGKQSNSKEFITKKSIDTKSKTQYKKNKANYGLQSDVKEFISKELLKNFDSKKLNYEQNDKLRSVITKTTQLASTNNTLENVVNDLKRRKAKKLKD